MNEKYMLTDEVMYFKGHTLHRIKALSSFSDVEAGELGGWVESEKNLSQYGDCWIAMEAKAYENAEVYDDAMLTDEAVACDNATICERSLVCGKTIVSGFTYVCGSAEAHGESILNGETRLYGSVRVIGAKVVDAKVGGYTIICDGASVCGRIKIDGMATIKGGAVVCNNNDYIVFKNFWSSGRYFTWTRSNNMWSVGCFLGSGEELIEKAYKDSERSGREYKRIVDYVNSILKDGY